MGRCNITSTTVWPDTSKMDKKKTTIYSKRSEINLGIDRPSLSYLFFFFIAEPTTTTSIKKTTTTTKKIRDEFDGGIFFGLFGFLCRMSRRSHLNPFFWNVFTLFANGYDHFFAL